MTRPKVLKLMRLEKALMKLEEVVSSINLDVEGILLENCVGRVLAEDVVAHADILSYNKVAIDGYATKWEFVADASRDH